MEFAELQPDLKQWIQDAVTRGQCQSKVMDALLKAGYQPSIARAVEQCIATHTVNPNGAAALKPELNATPEPRPAAKPSETTDASSRFRLFEPEKNVYDLGDRQVEILLAMKQPNIVLFGNLLSENECDGLIEMSRPHLQPSRLVNSASGSFDIGEERTSFGTYFDRGANPLIAGIEARIARLLGAPESRGEPMQILHYQSGAEYRPHFDFFNPEKPGSKEILARGGQRVGTLIMYLNDVEAGGSTVFPKVSLDVLPKKGCGLFFSYANADGELDRLTLHGGSPVISGEKWIATKWLRLYERDTGHA
ncbi:2OG-Fe(II) oxygenase [uncultured Microbulbifer sp.]|uniref:2OG-Fe(II) oxygenase n=1 Tax=uncultured Microbulbifer sp. TaxID=348147 RepID=UPI0026315E60|nr:2OG-Fe(II) oxygenase [uncultured Microbulbifer sp.]